MKLSPLFAALLVAAVPASAAKRKKHAAVRAEDAKKKAVAPAPKAPAAAPAAAVPVAPAAPVAVAPRDEAALAGFGAALLEDEEGLLLADARPGSPAAALGLKSGDRVWRVDRAAVKTRAEAAAARRASAPEERESVVVRRGLETLALSGAEASSPTDFSRGSADLSAREKVLAEARAKRDDAAARDAVAEAHPLDWNLRADQAFWVRFPGGLPAGLTRGAIVEAEAATGLTTDGSLDFLAVPPKSRVWARVVEASDDGSVRTVRLAFYKMRPAGGRVYPISGVATALAGVAAPELAHASAGGTLIAAAPLPPTDGKKKRPEPVFDEDARVRVRLLDPVVLSEAPSWWRSGPGLWLKTASDKEGRRRFQVTHVVSARSGAAAGLKVGDLLDGVGGRSSEKMDFEEALDALYGPAGTTVKVSMVLPGGSKTLELARGVKLDAKGVATPLPMPFEAR